MGEGAQRSQASYRSACTECARRKQKCNREWPCNGCQKRKVADKCRFKDTNQPVNEKAALDRYRRNRINNKTSPDSVESQLEDSGSDGIDALGYMPSHLIFDLTSKYENMKTASQEFVKDPRSFPQLERALRIIPSKLYTDTLVQNFLNNVNYHYYIIYPPSFLEQYQQWWTARAENRPLSVQWTCLLLTVCACASQYTDVELQEKLESGLGDTIKRITERFHEAARELGSAVPLGYSHLTNIQQLLHSCYWFKSEARFVECWHVLNSAVREAQELSIHQEAKTAPVSEFDLEMRRRVWCVLDTWDWQISTLLGRPMIIDRSDCDTGLPSLSLEGYQYPPLAHMKMQSSLIRQIFARFGPTKNVKTHAEVQEYQRIVEAWINNFPPPFNIHNPDKTLDASYPWIKLHRHFIRTVAFSMLLQPIRGFLTRPFAIRSLEPELQIRKDGINYCLELMVSLRGFFDHVYPRDAKFHFVLFCIFDISTVLCSAVLHDEHHTLPRREDVYRTIDEAHSLLQSLRTITKSAQASYGILTRIVQRLPRTTTTHSLVGKSPVLPRSHVPEAVVSPQTISPGSAHQHNSPPATTFSPSPIAIPTPGVPSPIYSLAGAATMGGDFATPVAYVAPPACAEWQPNLYMQDPTVFAPMDGPSQDAVFAHISDEELGELANLWNYQSLDFGFMNA
ncbi:fungal-specific transcription factor domain-containing protein [Fusarium tricinctum]|uniref:Fungal-specific transcription factor domain-containing protein n=1 Tax=Fusarium tricinctum TaxID=61284 RepID=A0A8K0S4R7_9HYPO|nr:fungal-specific transcription factor domain-containing protein [Fusarium tricinctum]